MSKTPKQRGVGLIKSSSFGFLLSLPSLLSIMILTVFPVIWVLYISFTNLTIGDPKYDFVGLSQYSKLIASEDLWVSTILTLQYSLMVVIGASTLGLFIALVLNSDFVGKTFLRTILIIPWSVPWIINGFLWAWIFDANFGLMNNILFNLHLIDNFIVFLNPDLALIITALAAIWIQSSFTGLLCLSGLQVIPQELYEAAEIDGAGLLTKFTNVTFPYVRSSLSLAALVSALVGLTMFDLVYIMTKGGPGTSTLLLAFYVFRQFFISLRIGQGAATSIILTAIVLIVGVVYMTLLYRKVKTAK